MQIVVMGPPGAGKGTQSKRLESELSLTIVASGDIFRAIRLEDTPVAAEVRAIMDRGEYVSDELTIEVVLHRLSQPDVESGFLLDGFPRTTVQAHALDEWLGKKERSIDLALEITAPTAQLIARILGRIICSNCHAVYNSETRRPRSDMICDVCGHHLERRRDEEPDILRSRLEAHRLQTEKVVTYYQEKGVLVRIDGTTSVEDVSAQVDRAVQGVVKVGT
jgi:adenylate kinase